MDQSKQFTASLIVALDRTTNSNNFQDGKEVIANDRIEIIERGCIRKIVINDVTAADEGK